MTAPDPNTIAAIVQLGYKERDAAELRMKQAIQRHRWLLAGIAIAVLFLAWQGWKYHVAKLAALDAQAHVQRTVATNEHKLGEAWKARAVALTDSVKHDTVRVRQIITQTKTVLVPVQAPQPREGVTYSVPLPLEPIPMVARADFDLLGAACTRVEHDCASALAAKDSALSHADSMAKALAALNHNTEQRLSSVKRADLVKEGGIAAIFYILGHVLK